MAKNLRARMPAEDTLFVHDVNVAATKKFLEENPTGVRIAENVREVAEKAVSLPCLLILPLHDETNCSIYDLSWESLVTLLLITPLYSQSSDALHSPHVCFYTLEDLT
jgi:hypothetical protein